MFPYILNAKNQVYKQVNKHIRIYILNFWYLKLLQSLHTNNILFNLFTNSWSFHKGKKKNPLEMFLLNQSYFY